VRVRIATIALVVALAAGCSDGQASAPGTSWAADSHDFVAHIEVAPLDRTGRLSAGPPLTMLVDTATGAFRISAGPPRRHARLLTVSNGHEATQISGLESNPVLTLYRGSQRYLADRAGGMPLRVVEAFLSGTKAPSGVRVRIVGKGPPARLTAATATERIQITIHRVTHFPADAFRAAPGSAAQVMGALRARAHRNSSISAYWLGPDPKGPGSGSGGWYTLGYPHVDVGLMGPNGITGTTPLTLADGTRGTLQVVRVQANGTVSVSSARTLPGSAVGMEGFVTTSTARPGSAVAFLFLPHAMVMLSGTAVTPRSAPAIARSLRPL
jgi:hypothetical protein